MIRIYDLTENDWNYLATSKMSKYLICLRSFLGPSLFSPLKSRGNLDRESLRQETGRHQQWFPISRSEFWFFIIILSASCRKKQRDSSGGYPGARVCPPGESGTGGKTWVGVLTDQYHTVWNSRGHDSFRVRAWHGYAFMRGLPWRVEKDTELVKRIWLNIERARGAEGVLSKYRTDVRTSKMSQNFTEPYSLGNIYIYLKK